MPPEAAKDASSASSLILAVIPHYRKPEQLERCLASLAASTVPVTPWVCDNNTRNIGFTRAINLGLKIAFSRGVKYSLLLNQDCYVRPDAVGNLVAFMESHPHCALAGVKQVRADDPDFIMHAGCTSAFPQGMHHAGRKSNGDHTISRPMPWVNGAAIFARMSAVLEFGLMDQNMLMVGSDSDWCYTARSRGWEVWYCADAEAVHEQGITSQPATPELQRVFQSDMTWWKNKWLGSALFNRLCQPIAYEPGSNSPRSTQQTEGAGVG